MQARYVILQVLLKAGNDFVQVKRTTGQDGCPDLIVSLDRTKITTVGKDAIAEFLKKLQVSLFYELFFTILCVFLLLLTLSLKFAFCH